MWHVLFVPYTKVHGFSVCDSPEYFYRYIDECVIGDLIGDLGMHAERSRSTSSMMEDSSSSHGSPNSPNRQLPAAREMVEIIDVQGRG